MPEMDGFPIDASWMEELPEHLQTHGRDLLDRFTTASLWMKSSSERGEEEEVHQQGHLLMGLAAMLIEGSFRVAQIESARSGTIGINPEILEAVQRSMFAGLLLSGIRFGQEHPQAFLEYQPADFAALLEELNAHTEGGEAGPDEESDQP